MTNDKFSISNFQSSPSLIKPGGAPGNHTQCDRAAGTRTKSLLAAKLDMGNAEESPDGFVRDADDLPPMSLDNLLND